MLGKKHQIARMQSDFYRMWYHKILRALIFSSILILCLIVAIIYFILSKPSQKYYATTTEGQVISITPAKR